MLLVVRIIHECIATIHHTMHPLELEVADDQVVLEFRVPQVKSFIYHVLWLHILFPHHELPEEQIARGLEIAKDELGSLKLKGFKEIELHSKMARR